jgi:c-di-GMP-binding flagellar brake protein YcgR
MAAIERMDSNSPTDDFFRGLRGAMSPQPNMGLHALYGVLGILLFVGAWWLIARSRRLRAEHDKLAALAHQKHLTPIEAQLIERMARRAELVPVTIATRIDLFERASAALLAERQPKLDFKDDDVLAVLGRLRKKLGFDRLPAHFPLLTSRELSPSFALEILQTPARILDVNESYLLVRVATQTPVGRNERLAVSVVHSAEARYALECRVLGVEPVGDAELELHLAHDESPERVQHRKYARVPMAGVVPVTVPPNSLYGVSVTRNELAQLVNVSAGGMLIELGAELPQGIGVSVTFDIRGAAFALDATVLRSQRERGRYATVLLWKRVDERVRASLVAAISQAASLAER